MGTWGIRISFVLLILLCVFSVQAQHPFSGSWICASEDVKVGAAPLFRKEFETATRRCHYGDGMRVQKATLYISGLGYYSCTVNGKPVTDAVLNQGFTRYDSRVLYDSYDVTSLVRTGRNCIGVELGNGWFNMQSLTIWNFDKVGWRRSPRLMAKLVLEYRNGSKEIVSSDGSWKCGYGASAFNSLIAGEIYDARKEVMGWNLAGFDDKRWLGASVTASPGGTLEAQTMPPVRVIREIRPVSLRDLGKGLWLYDMGENFAGVCRLSVSGKAGDSVVLRHSERLNADGSFDALQNAGHMIGPDSDPKFATDIYVLRGGGREVFSPRFTYHGFRYVLVAAPVSVRLNLNSVTGLFYSTDFKRLGLFNSSSVMLNKLYAAALQSYRSNYVGIPTDCPQREKMGWLADAQLISEFGLWNFKSASGYRKFLGDIRDVQLADGSLPGVAPTKGIGYHWIDPEDRDFGPGWGSALPVIAWNVFCFSGDTSVLKDNYTAASRYVNLLASRARASGYIYRTGLDDFLSLEKTPKAITSTCFLYQDAMILAKMAGVMGMPSQRAAYLALADSVKLAFNQEFFDFSAGRYKVRTATALSGALVSGLVPVGFVDSVAADLAAGIWGRDSVPDFGLFGTKWVLSALSDHGYADQAFRLLSNPSAGWGKWMSDGHTTLLEGWEPKDQSWNHVFFGDYAAWYFRALSGIKLDEAAPGFKRFGIAPVFPAGLDGISVSHDCRYGKIGVSWKRVSSGISLLVSVPSGTSAALIVPGYERELAAGKHRLLIKK